ncbi:HNH endonuclease [bacterium]|nr:HNH endonuclease [bacterium]
MPPKLTIEVINARIHVDNYTCIDYDTLTRKFSYICPEGHTGSTRMDHWNRGVRCAVCEGNKKLTLESVRNEIEKEEYTLLSTEYINSKTLLDVVCPEGHEFTISYNNWGQDYRCPRCSYLARTGKGNHNYKGGVTKLELPLYETFASQLEPYQIVHKVTQDGLDLLGVECAFCKQLYVPRVYDIRMRLATISGLRSGDQNLYCSNDCKQLCPTYRQILYFKNNKPYKENNRHDQKAWASLVKERDNYTCQNCGTTEGQMIAHHIDPVINNPIESADIDNGITLCKKCDKVVHKLPGCNYSDLRC